VHQRKKKKEREREKTAQISPYEAYTNYCSTLGVGRETKRKKEFNLEACEKGDLKNNVKKIKRQRNTIQINEQTRNKQVQTNEEIGKLPEKEFRMRIVNMIQNLENRMEKMQETINNKIEELKNKHIETNNTITEIKNILEGINGRISEAEERISELENKMVEITSEKQKKVKRMKRTEGSLRDFWDNTKCTNIQIIGAPEEAEKNKAYEKIFEEIIVEDFPNMEKEIVNQVQEVQIVPCRITPRRNIPRHTLIKLKKIKHKEIILKAAREKQQVTYKGNPIYLTADAAAETLQARRQWQDILKVLKGKHVQPRLLYLARISFKIGGEIKSFSDK